MQTPAQVSFDGIPVSETVHAAALEQVDHLEHLFGRITGCRVVIAQPHRHQRTGRLFSVRIDVRLPGGGIVVNRDHHLDHAHEDVFVALRDSFAAAGRGLEDRVRRMRGVEKRHADRARGHVSRLFPREGYGFIETPDGSEVYFHRHALSDHEFAHVAIGSEVMYGAEEGDEGPRAAFVRLVHPRHPAHSPGTPRAGGDGIDGETSR